MTLDEIKARLVVALTPKRYAHSINVMKTSMEIAEKYGADPEKALLAGLLHDCARDISDEEILELCKKYDIITDEITREQPSLLHGQIGAFIARDSYGVTCGEVLEAIAYHTMGRSGMPILSKVVFVADFIEPARSYPGVEEIRKESQVSLEKAMLKGIDNTIGHLLDIGKVIHADTVKTRNWVLNMLKHNA
jgi:predicted HD superfamily hydrolase involved in NAD metabolism